MVTTQNMPTPSSLPTSKISENNAKDSIHNQGKQQQQQQQQQDQSNEQEKKHEKKQQEQQNPLQEMESMIDFSDLLNCFVRIERCQVKNLINIGSLFMFMYSILD